MTFNTDLCLTNTDVTIDSYNNNYVTDIPKCIIYEPTSMDRIASMDSRIYRSFYKEREGYT